MIKRLKKGGIIAREYNRLLDYIPRTRIQNSPDVSASSTPTGQIIKPRKPKSLYYKDVLFYHPFQILRMDDGWKIYYGTVNGEDAFPYPFYEFDPPMGMSRVEITWNADFNGMQGEDFSAYKVSNISISTKDTGEPFVQEGVSPTQLTLTVILGFVSKSQDTFAIEQIVKGHLPAYIG